MTDPAPSTSFEPERARPEFEREKWQAEQSLRREEIELKRDELNRSRWVNPLVIAVFAAAAAALGNAGVAWFTANRQVSLEEQRARISQTLNSQQAEAARILEVVKTNDPDKAAANLKFLTEAGLIVEPDLRKKIQAYLDKRQPGEGISLPSPDGSRSNQLTPSREYTLGIEGPAVDSAGTLYVVNFQRQGTIGMLRPGADKSELFAELPAGSVGNSIRFDRGGRMYVADFKKHNIFVFEPGSKEPRVYFHSDSFYQPNDLTIAADGTIYASDPLFSRRQGQVWRVTRGPDGTGQGAMMASERAVGVANGVDLSPDEKTLYVGESATREIWAYRLEGPKLASPRLVTKFSDFEIGGLRADVDGKLFVTRPGAGLVTVLLPDGKVEREIKLRAKAPTNLAFGGPDGRTVYVAQSEGGFIEAFHVERPGREFCLQKASDPSCQPR